MAVMYQPFSGRYPPVTNCLDARDGPGWSPSKTYQMVVSKPHVHTYPKYTNIYIYIYRIPHIWEYPNHPVIYIYVYSHIMLGVSNPIRSGGPARRRKAEVHRGEGGRFSFYGMRNVVITLGEWMVYL